MAKGEKKVVVEEERKVITETSYCKVYKAVSIIDDDYYRSIEKIKVKSKNPEEVRFTLQKTPLGWNVNSFLEVWI